MTKIRQYLSLTAVFFLTTHMLKIVSLHELSNVQFLEYRRITKDAFPEIIGHSQIIHRHWATIESYFPTHQRFLLEKEEIIGFVNSIPIFWNKSLHALPQEGWDWLVKKGIEDFESNQAPNMLGGLQIIIRKKSQGCGLSKKLIEAGKALMEAHRYTHFIIPIRPTFKHQYPNMKMVEYMQLKKNNEIYDPWIRTHLKNKAHIINVCSNSMTISGDIALWKRLSKTKIMDSGTYIIEGALNPVTIDLTKDTASYEEENIWIYYQA